MKDWRKKRKENLAELTLGTHILAYLLAIIILVSAETFFEEYTFNTTCILLISTVLPAAVFVLLDYHFLQGSYDSRVMRVWNITKLTLLYAVITAVFMKFQGEHLWLFASIYLLPVVLSSITLGKRWGMVFAATAVGSIFFLSGGMGFAGNQNVNTVEAILVLGGIFILFAWLFGGILEVEQETTEKISQERDLIMKMMDTSPAGIMVLGYNREIVYANARVEQIFSSGCVELQEMINRGVLFSPGESTPSCLDKVFQSVLARGEPVYNYLETITRDGAKDTYVSVSGAPISKPDGGIEQVVLAVDDVTKQKIIAEEMLKADKLESLGLLAGGIAHDFNNYLAVILGNISLVKIWNENEKAARSLEHMEKAVLQARELTRKLFIFARGGAPVRKTLQLNNLLLDTVGFALCGSMVAYETRLADDLRPVEADEAQIGQVINNILLNAVQAMPNGGKIKLAAANMTIDRTESGLPLPQGDYIHISITDEGIGIPADQLGKIYDPFFSTKPKGSGLGLATVYTIVQSHGGLIRAESEPGVGTTFNIYLPASTKHSPADLEESEELYIGEARILIMDDDELLLKACGDMLIHLGCRVSYALDGAEMVRLYQEAAEAQAGSAYDVVIMDLTIPGGMGGVEAMERLRRLDPGVKAIVSSGYSDSSVITRYKNYGFSGYVNKPYRMKELSEVLKKVLNPAQDSAS